jgi:hypothetical protein
LRPAILSYGQFDLTCLIRYNTHSGFATLLGIPAFLSAVFGRAGFFFRQSRRVDPVTLTTRRSGESHGARR